MEDKIGSFGGFVICCNDIVGSIDWWTDVVGLEKGYTPPNELHSQWLYINKLPILQLYPVRGDDQPWNTVIGGLNFNCVNMSYWVTKLSRLNIDFKHEVQSLGGFQVERLKIMDPNMLTVNLVFIGYDNFDTKDPRPELESEANG